MQTRYYLVEGGQDFYHGVARVGCHPSGHHHNSKGAGGIDFHRIHHLPQNITMPVGLGRGALYLLADEAKLDVFYHALPMTRFLSPVIKYLYTAVVSDA